MLRLLFSFTVLIALQLSAQDSSRFVIAKHIFLGAGVSNYIGNTPEDYLPFFTTEFGFDWTHRLSPRYTFDLGWNRVKYRYNEDWGTTQNHPHSTPYQYRYIHADIGIDIHMMNWIQPSLNSRIKMGVGGAMDILLFRGSNRVTSGGLFEMLVFGDQDVVLVQPCILAGIGIQPKEFRRITPEIIGRYGIYTTKNLERWPVIDDEIQSHRFSLMLRMNINIDVTTQRARRANSKEKMDTVIMDHRWSFYLEAFGASSFISLNTECAILKRESSKLAVYMRGGFLFDDYLKPGFVFMPLVTYGERRLQLEAGAGVSLFVDQIWIPFNTGMRITLGKKWFGRINYTPTIIYNPTYRYTTFEGVWGGISIGYHWRKKS